MNRTHLLATVALVALAAAATLPARAQSAADSLPDHMVSAAPLGDAMVPAAPPRAAAASPRPAVRQPDLEAFQAPTRPPAPAPAPAQMASYPAAVPYAGGMQQAGQAQPQMAQQGQMMMPAGGQMMVPATPQMMVPVQPQMMVPAQGQMMVPAGGQMMVPAGGYAPQQGYPGMAPGAMPGSAAGAPGGGAVSPEDELFRQAMDLQNPMNGGQITTFRRTQRDIRGAERAPLGDQHGTAHSISLSLKPGEAMPTLKLAPGNATVISFFDSTGSQWPVLSVTTGNPDLYSPVELGDKGKSNMVVISPKTNSGQANLVITLLGNSSPAIFSLETVPPDTSGKVDYRLDVGIKSRGPNARYDIARPESLLNPTNDTTMLQFVDGLPPKGARSLATHNNDVEAWRYNDVVYVRTPLTLVSPPYDSKSGLAGINVYTMSEAPILVFSQDGRLVDVTLDR